MPKQTRLDEHATIYQPRKEQSEKEKLKDMLFRDKLSYLWEYYKIHAAVFVAVIALIIYIIYEIITPNVKPQLYAALINSAVDHNTLEEYANTFGEYLELNPKKQSIFLNDQFYFSSESAYTPGTQDALTTFIAAGEVDIIIAPETVFNNFAHSGYTAKLSDELPTDVYSALTDYFYITDTTDDPGKYAYGIYLDNTDLFKDLKFNGESYVLGILPNYPHEENTVDFISYLFKDK